MAQDAAPGARMRLVLAASAAGTVFEWYDFFIFGSLAAIIAKHFFAGAGETQGFIFALLTFAAGFAVRPLGAIVFGSFGDRTGRKRTFLVTITVMGVATFAIGLLPDASSLGLNAAYLLLAMRGAAGLRRRRRIWRSGDLCRRACGPKQARRRDGLDPGRGLGRPVPRPWR